MPSTTRAGSPAGLLLFLRVCIALAFAMISLPLLLASSASADEHDKVGICHSTNSDSNPYVYLEVPADEANGHLTGTGQQHNEQHTWKSDGTWNGVPHADGDEKMDYLANEEDAATNCGPRTPPVEVCPEGTDKAGEEIPEGQTAEEFCNEADEPEVCPEGTDNAGQEIPEGETVESFCNEADNPPEPINPPIVNPPAVNPPAVNPPVVNPPAPILPNTGSSPYLTGLALMGGLLLTAGSALLLRSRKVRVPKA